MENNVDSEVYDCNDWKRLFEIVEIDYILPKTLEFLFDYAGEYHKREISLDLKQKQIPANENLSKKDKIKSVKEMMKEYESFESLSSKDKKLEMELKIKVINHPNISKEFLKSKLKEMMLSNKSNPEIRNLITSKLMSLI